MPPSAAIPYVVSKAKRESYEMDLLWSVAVGSSREKRTYVDVPRWDEFCKGKQEIKSGKTGDRLAEEFFGNMKTAAEG